MPSNKRVSEQFNFLDIVGYCFHIADLHGARAGRLWDGSRREEVKYECKKFSRYEAGAFTIWFRLSFAPKNNSLDDPVVELSLTVHVHDELVLEACGRIVGRVPSNIQLKKYLQGGEWADAIQAHAYTCAHCRYSGLFAPPGPTEYQKRLEDIMSNCIEFVERNKKHPYKQEGPSAHSGWVEYRNNGLTIRCCAQSTLVGNGYCGVTVFENDRLVFHAEGGYRIGPHRVLETVYIPGAWESAILKSN